MKYRNSGTCKEILQYEEIRNREERMPTPRQTLRNIISVKIFSFEKPIVLHLYKPIDLNLSQLNLYRSACPL
jgi:hypothetical protein